MFVHSSVPWEGYEMFCYPLQSLDQHIPVHSLPFLLLLLHCHCLVRYYTAELLNFLLYRSMVILPGLEHGLLDANFGGVNINADFGICPFFFCICGICI